MGCAERNGDRERRAHGLPCMAEESKERETAEVLTKLKEMGYGR